jgi:hypothetical protein
MASLFENATQSEAAQRYESLMKQIGKAALSAMFPNDFETYFCALELVDSKDNVIDYFSFPIMPSSMRYTYNEITNIKKTAGGITAVSSPTFVPVDINIEGNFGRRFKFLIGSSQFNANAFRFSTQGGNYSLTDTISTLKKAAFDPTIKTGYGCFKILKAICDKAKGLDQFNQPFKLYFYNPAIGENYLVKPMTFTGSQNGKESNMIWNYNISFKGVAPLDSLKPDLQKSLIKGMAFDKVQKRMTNLISNVKRSLNNVSI